MADYKHTFDWYLNCILAGVTALLLCLGFASDVVTFIYGDAAVHILTPDPHPGFLGLALLLVTALIWFWFRMLNDYVRNRPARHTVVWGWALVLLIFAGALAYFWFIWRPRQVEARTSDA